MLESDDELNCKLNLGCVPGVVNKTKDEVFLIKEEIRVGKTLVGVLHWTYYVSITGDVELSTASLVIDHW